MGSRGPLPMPDNVRQLRGNPGKRQSKPPLKAKPVAPSAPTWLDREGKAEWKRIVTELEELGIVAKLDRAVLAIYCDAWSKFVELRSELKKHGLLTAGQKGNLVRHPNWLLYRDAASTVMELAKQLGATPTARLRLTLPELPDADEDDIWGN